MTAVDEGKRVAFEMVDDYVLITDVTGETACVPAKAILRYADRVRESGNAG